MGDVIFDLFGDPIPEGLGKRGRPPHLVTDEKRCKVMLLLAVGREDVEIAAALGITDKTLRKHYFRELRSREEARFRAEGTNLLKLYQQVEAGNVSAMKELRKVLEKAELGDPEFMRRHKARKQKPLGKKEQADIDAAKAPEDTGWGDLVGRRPN